MCCLMRTISLKLYPSSVKDPSVLFHNVRFGFLSDIPDSFFASNLIMNTHSSTWYQKESQKGRNFSTSTSDFYDIKCTTVCYKIADTEGEIETRVFIWKSGPLMLNMIM